MINNEAITQEKPLYIKAFRLFAIALCCGLSLILSLFKGVRGIVKPFMMEEKTK